ncbi:MAG: hypothetical protein JWP97_524 [Labilithrix sp.]|nr:hypothetical protein [Labilithrix sp.]
MVRAEWELLAEGIAALPGETRAVVAERIASLAAAERDGSLPRHITCPLLDEAEGACLVYASRPGACRTYGFYVERGIGLHCDQITAAVEAHEDEAVTWGNQEGVDEALARMRPSDGPREPSLPLTAWVSSSPSVLSGDTRPDPSSPSSAM